ncbi:MAG: polymerase subunit chi, partial [Pseudomonadota bacterium]|nr:polymerase subunit chi [Pseudomonadota bacterium]
MNALATKVDFYLLGAPDPRARLATACRLAEKAFDQGMRVTVRTASPAEAVELDDLLWTFSDRSFVPHAVWPADPALAEETPVLIASGALPGTHRDVLIHLAAEPPADALG